MEYGADVFTDPLMANETQDNYYRVIIRDEAHIEILVIAWQYTEWSYAPGISSTLTKGIASYSDLRDGYSVTSGGDIVTTNNDGTQQVASYFRIVAPDGRVSCWYKMLSVCSVDGVVSASSTMLPY